MGRVETGDIEAAISDVHFRIDGIRACMNANPPPGSLRDLPTNAMGDA
jgi:hypothetical protein